MNICATTSRNPLARRFMQTVPPEDVLGMKGLSGNLDIVFYSVTMEHKGPDEHFRPYLDMMGHVRSLRDLKASFGEEGMAPVKMPYGIEDITFPETEVPVHFYYEFSDEQLKNLVDKGLFRPGFQSVPDILTQAVFEDIAADDIGVTLIKPDETKPFDNENVPVLVLNFDAAQLQEKVLTDENSGYDLDKYYQTALGYVPEKIPDLFTDYQLPTEEELFPDLEQPEETTEASAEEPVQESYEEEEIPAPGEPETQEEVEDRMYAEMQALRNRPVEPYTARAASESEEEPDWRRDEKEAEALRSVKSREEIARQAADETRALDNQKDSDGDLFID